MNTATTVWPLCPRPEIDESLPSWFERVGYEYAMSPALLLGAVEQTTRTKRKVDPLLPASRLYESCVAERLTVLAQLYGTSSAGVTLPSPSQSPVADFLVSTRNAPCDCASKFPGTGGS